MSEPPSSNSGSDLTSASNKSDVLENSLGNPDMVQFVKITETIYSTTTNLDAKIEAVITGWEALQKIYISKDTEKFSDVFELLYSATAKLIIGGKWYTAFTMNNCKNGDKLKNDMMVPLKSIIYEASQDFPRENKMCRNLIPFLDKNPWSLPYIDGIVMPKNLPLASVVEMGETLWEKENKYFIEMRLECLCSQKMFSQAFNIAQVCYLECKKLQADQDSGSHTTISYNSRNLFSSHKFSDEIRNIYYLLLCRLKSDDAVPKYLIVSEALEVVRRINDDNSPASRIAPKWKDWKKACKTIINATVDFILSQNDEDVDRTSVKAAYFYWIKYTGQDNAEVSLAQTLLNRIDSINTDSVYAFADVIVENFPSETISMQKALELYIRAMTFDINQIEKLDVTANQSDKKQSLKNKLAERYLHLSKTLFPSNQKISWGLTLTAFSLCPTQELFNQLFSNSQDSTNEDGSDLEGINGAPEANTAVATLALSLSKALSEDLQTVIDNPRWKSLCWAKDKSELENLCRQQLDTGGPKIKAKEDLTHLHINYEEYEPRPDINLGEIDYGFEKGYEPSNFASLFPRKRGRHKKSVLLQKMKPRFQNYSNAFSKRGRTKFSLTRPVKAFKNTISKESGLLGMKQRVQGKKGTFDSTGALASNVTYLRRYQRRKKKISQVRDDTLSLDMNSFLTHLPRPCPSQNPIIQRGRLKENGNKDECGPIPVKFNRCTTIHCSSAAELKDVNASTVNSPNFNGFNILEIESIEANEKQISAPSASLNDAFSPSPEAHSAQYLRNKTDLLNMLETYNYLHPIKFRSPSSMPNSLINLNPVVEFENVIPDKLLHDSAKSQALDILIKIVQVSMKYFREGCFNPSMSPTVSNFIAQSKILDCTDDPDGDKFKLPPSIVPQIISEVCKHKMESSKFSHPQPLQVPPRPIKYSIVNQSETTNAPSIRRKAGPKRVTNILYAKQMVEKTTQSLKNNIDFKGKALGLKFAGGRLVRSCEFHHIHNGLETNLKSQDASFSICNDNTDCEIPHTTDHALQICTQRGDSDQSQSSGPASSVNLTPLENYFIAGAQSIVNISLSPHRPHSILQDPQTGNKSDIATSYDDKSTSTPLPDGGNDGIDVGTAKNKNTEFNDGQQNNINATIQNDNQEQIVQQPNCYSPSHLPPINPANEPFVNLEIENKSPSSVVVQSSSSSGLQNGSDILNKQIPIKDQTALVAFPAKDTTTTLAANARVDSFPPESSSSFSDAVEEIYNYLYGDFFRTYPSNPVNNLNSEIQSETDSTTATETSKDSFVNQSTRRSRAGPRSKTRFNVHRTAELVPMSIFSQSDIKDSHNHSNHNSSHGNGADEMEAKVKKTSGVLFSVDVEEDKTDKEDVDYVLSEQEDEKDDDYVPSDTEDQKDTDYIPSTPKKTKRKPRNPAKYSPDQSLGSRRNLNSNGTVHVKKGAKRRNAGRGKDSEKIEDFHQKTLPFVAPAIIPPPIVPIMPIPTDHDALENHKMYCEGSFFLNHSSGYFVNIDSNGNEPVEFTSCEVVSSDNDDFWPNWPDSDLFAPPAKESWESACYVNQDYFAPSKPSSLTDTCGKIDLERCTKDIPPTSKTENCNSNTNKNNTESTENVVSHDDHSAADVSATDDDLCKSYGCKPCTVKVKKVTHVAAETAAVECEPCDLVCSGSGSDITAVNSISNQTTVRKSKRVPIKSRKAQSPDSNYCSRIERSGGASASANKSKNKKLRQGGDLDWEGVRSTGGLTNNKAINKRTKQNLSKVTKKRKAGPKSKKRYRTDSEEDSMTSDSNSSVELIQLDSDEELHGSTAEAESEVEAEMLAEIRNEENLITTMSEGNLQDEVVVDCDDSELNLAASSNSVIFERSPVKEERGGITLDAEDSSEIPAQDNDNKRSWKKLTFNTDLPEDHVIDLSSGDENYDEDPLSIKDIDPLSLGSSSKQEGSFLNSNSSPRGRVTGSGSDPENVIMCLDSAAQEIGQEIQFQYEHKSNISMNMNLELLQEAPIIHGVGAPKFSLNGLKGENLISKNQERSLILIHDQHQHESCDSENRYSNNEAVLQNLQIRSARASPGHLISQCAVTERCAQLQPNTVKKLNLTSVGGDGYHENNTNSITSSYSYQSNYVMSLTQNDTFKQEIIKTEISAIEETDGLTVEYPIVIDISTDELMDDFPVQNSLSNGTMIHRANSEHDNEIATANSCQIIHSDKEIIVVSIKDHFDDEGGTFRGGTHEQQSQIVWRDTSVSDTNTQVNDVDSPGKVRGELLTTSVIDNLNEIDSDEQDNQKINQVKDKVISVGVNEVADSNLIEVEFVEIHENGDSQEVTETEEYEEIEELENYPVVFAEKDDSAPESESQCERHNVTEIEILTLSAHENVSITTNSVFQSQTKNSDSDDNVEAADVVDEVDKHHMESPFEIQVRDNPKDSSLSYTTTSEKFPSCADLNDSVLELKETQPQPNLIIDLGDRKHKHDTRKANLAENSVSLSSLDTAIECQGECHDIDIESDNNDAVRFHSTPDLEEGHPKITRNQGDNLIESESVLIEHSNQNQGNESLLSGESVVSLSPQHEDAVRLIEPGTNGISSNYSDHQAIDDSVDTENCPTRTTSSTEYCNIQSLCPNAAQGLGGDTERCEQVENILRISSVGPSVCSDFQKEEEVKDTSNCNLPLNIRTGINPGLATDIQEQGQGYHYHDNCTEELEISSNSSRQEEINNLNDCVMPEPVINACSVPECESELDCSDGLLIPTDSEEQPLTLNKLGDSENQRDGEDFQVLPYPVNVQQNPDQTEYLTTDATTRRNAVTHSAISSPFKKDRDFISEAVNSQIKSKETSLRGKIWSFDHEDVLGHSRPISTVEVRNCNEKEDQNVPLVLNSTNFSNVQTKDEDHAESGCILLNEIVDDHTVTSVAKFIAAAFINQETNEYGVRSPNSSHIDEFLIESGKDEIGGVLKSGKVQNRTQNKRKQRRANTNNKLPSKASKKQVMPVKVEAEVASEFHHNLIQPTINDTLEHTDAQQLHQAKNNVLEKQYLDQNQDQISASISPLGDSVLFNNNENCATSTDIDCANVCESVETSSAPGGSCEGSDWESFKDKNRAVSGVDHHAVSKYHCDGNRLEYIDNDNVNVDPKNKEERVLRKRKVTSTVQTRKRSKKNDPDSNVVVDAHSAVAMDECSASAVFPSVPVPMSYDGRKDSRNIPFELNVDDYTVKIQPEVNSHSGLVETAKMKLVQDVGACSGNTDDKKKANSCGPAHNEEAEDFIGFTQHRPSNDGSGIMGENGNANSGASSGRDEITADISDVKQEQSTFVGIKIEGKDNECDGSVRFKREFDKGFASPAYPSSVSKHPDTDDIETDGEDAEYSSLCEFEPVVNMVVELPENKDLLGGIDRSVECKHQRVLNSLETLTPNETMEKPTPSKNSKGVGDGSPALADQSTPKTKLRRTRRVPTNPEYKFTRSRRSNDNTISSKKTNMDKFEKLVSPVRGSPPILLPEVTKVENASQESAKSLVIEDTSKAASPKIIQMPNLLRTLPALHAAPPVSPAALAQPVMPSLMPAPATPKPALMTTLSLEPAHMNNQDIALKTAMKKKETKVNNNTRKRPNTRATCTQQKGAKKSKASENTSRGRGCGRDTDLPVLSKPDENIERSSEMENCNSPAPPTLQPEI